MKQVILFGLMITFFLLVQSPVKAHDTASISGIEFTSVTPVPPIKTAKKAKIPPPPQ